MISFSRREKYIRDICSRFNRILLGNVPKILRKKITSCYSTLVFFRDQIANLKDNKVERVSSSDLWLSYNLTKEIGKLNVQLFGEQFTYAWEYQGLKPYPVFHDKMRVRLKSIMRAMNSGNVSALVGEKDSGKTETVKSLSVILGCQLYTIHCNSSMDSEFVFKALRAAVEPSILLLLDEVQILRPLVVANLSQTLGEMFQSPSDTQGGAVKGMRLSVEATTDYPRVFVEIAGINGRTRKVNEILKRFANSYRFMDCTFRLVRITVIFYV